MMYYSAHWEIRQMIFWTSSLCLYTNSSTSSTATEKKEVLIQQIQTSGRKKPNKNEKQLVDTCDLWPCAACWRVLRSRVQSSHMDTSSAHTRKKKKILTSMYSVVAVGLLRRCSQFPCRCNWSVFTLSPQKMHFGKKCILFTVVQMTLDVLQ